LKELKYLSNLQGVKAVPGQEDHIETTAASTVVIMATGPAIVRKITEVDALDHLKIVTTAENVGISLANAENLLAVLSLDVLVATVDLAANLQDVEVIVIAIEDPVDHIENRAVAVVLLLDHREEAGLRGAVDRLCETDRLCEPDRQNEANLLEASLL
jgi:hypothetical protein